MFKSRVALAATLSSTYGIYNGFELLEHEPIPGREEYLNSEKYEIKVRDWDRPGNIKPYIRDLNRARRENTALQQTSHLRFIPVDDGNVIGFVKESANQTNSVVVAIALSRDVHEFWLPLGDIEVGMAGDRRPVAAVENLMTGERYPARLGRHPSADRSGTRSRAAVPLSGVRGTMNLLSSIDATELPVTSLDGDELWYKDAIIYQLHVKAFADSNNDGIGDFAGLTEKLDYLQDLGVTALWLLPFYPSPGRDDGYDIADYGAINPDFGTMKDFQRFIVEAKRRGLRVITELVINHTSDQHDWFKRARRSDPKSSARNWYVWSDTDQKYPGTRIIFTDTEKSNWTWDPEAGQFYWHRFFSHQPDLNFDNPRVRQRDGPGHEALARHRRRRLPSRRRSRICASATAPTTRTCRRPTPSSGSCAPSSTPTPRARCCWPKPINGRRTCRNISATATNATWPIISR